MRFPAWSLSPTAFLVARYRALPRAAGGRNHSVRVRAQAALTLPE